MPSLQHDTSPTAIRAMLRDLIAPLRAQGATVAELVEGLEWARAILPEADAYLAEFAVELRGEVSP